MGEYRDEFTARCTWVRANNGIYRALYEIEAGVQYVLVNRRIDHGHPDELKPYWWTCGPHFPHERKSS